MPLLPASTTYDQVPLKRNARGALGTPDVYPQQVNQKEDHFYSHVKQGFQNPALDDEHKSSNKKLILENKDNLLKCIADIKAKREEQHAASVSVSESKKKLFLSKERFWPYHYKVKPQLSSWMNDLSSNKDLSHLGRKIPFFQRREELLFALAEHKVPLIKAVWVIKLDAYHKMSQVDNTSKKKPRGSAAAQMPDMCFEWTQSVCQFMKNLYKRILDHEHRVSPLSEESYPQQCSVWEYTTRLVSFMFEEGLLDKHEFLSWLLQAIQVDLKPPEDPFNRLFIPLIYSYLDEIVLSETLSRRLAFFCARNLTQMYDNSVEAAAIAALSPNATNTDPRWLHQQQIHIMASLNPKNVWEDYLHCPHHRGMVMSLSCALQVITMCCPSALVWVIPSRSKNELLSPTAPMDDSMDGPSNQPEEGSPLDILPVAPSELPLPFSEMDGSEIAADTKDQLVYLEEIIRNRSMAVEQRWSSAKYQESSFGNEVQRVLEIIQDLDTYNFNMNSALNNMKVLSAKIFKRGVNDTYVVGSGSGKEVSGSDWLVVKTLCDWATTSHRPGCHRAAVVAAVLAHQQVACHQTEDGTPKPYALQAHLVKFLDEFAPTLKLAPGSDENTFEEERMFTSLIFLMHELIDADVFSHDQYLRLLISRGDLTTGALYPTPDTSGEGMDENCVADQPISNFAEKRHLLFTLQFPVSPDSANDVNQRLMLLYGFGSNRALGMAEQKSLSQDLSKLITASAITEEAQSDNIEALRTRFLKLCFHDRQQVVKHCVGVVSHQLDCVAELGLHCGIGGVSLPLISTIEFVTQLCESAACVAAILDIAENILSNMPQLLSIVPEEYSSSLMMVAVANIQLFVPYILITDEIAVTIFESVQTAVSAIEDGPESCSSSQRCLFHLLEHLLDCSELLKQTVNPPDKYQHILSALNQPVPVPKMTSEKVTSSSEDAAIAKSFLEKLSDVNEDAFCEIMSRLQTRDSFRAVFISTALIKLCDFKDVDKVQKANELSLLCVQVTSAVPFLKSDWFTAVNIICSQKPSGANKVLDSLIKKVNIEHSHVFDNVVVFICYMVARHMFKLEEVFVKLIHFILASLNENSDASGPGEREINASTRLSMYVLLKLLFANQELNCIRLNVFEFLNSPSDRRLLEVHLRPVNVGLLVAILKAFATHVPIPVNTEDDDHKRVIQFEPFWTSKQVLEFVESGNLQDVACAVLHALSSCMWITYSCLRNPGVLKADEILLDEIGGERLASHILQLLCYPGNVVKNARYTDGTPFPQCSQGNPGADEQETKLRRIFENLNKWNHRSSWLQFTIILESCEWKNTMDLFNLLARLSIEIFDIQPVIELRSSQRRPTKTLNVEKHSDQSHSQNSSNQRRDPEQAWLVAPLIGQLPAAVQGAVLNHASSMLDRGGSFPSGHLSQSLSSSGLFSSGLGSGSKQRSEKEKTAQKSIQLLSHGPFLSLVLTCLKGQDDQRERLLSSLQTQFNQMIKEQQQILSASANPSVTSLSGVSFDELQSNRLKIFNDELQLRLSLLGSMFDSILRNQALSIDWISNLVNILEKDIINPVDNAQLFYTVVDMLVILMEWNSGDHPNADESSRKTFNNIVKKIKNSIGEKQNEGLRLVRQLLPLAKATTDVICCEPIGTVYDAKGNKVETSSSSNKQQQGHQVIGKQKLSPWDLIEGFKITHPLALNWFGVTRMDKSKAPVYEEQARAMFHHDHSPLDRSNSYFMQPITSGASPVSDEEEQPVEVPPASVAPVVTAANPKPPRPKYVRSNSGPKKQTKSRKTKAQTQQGAQQPPTPINVPPPTPISSLSGFPQNSGFMQNATVSASIVPQNNRFPSPQAQSLQPTAASVPPGQAVVVQNVAPSNTSAGHLQSYFQQQQAAQQQSQTIVGVSNQHQGMAVQMPLQQAPPQAANQMVTTQQQVTPRQQLTKHLKNKTSLNNAAASVVGMVRNQAPVNMAPRMPMQQTMYRPSYPTDAQTAFGAAQAKMTAPGGAMMANAVNPTQQQQQMMYAAHQSQIVMQQQQQQQQQTSNQFLSMGGPQTTQSFQRLTPQQQHLLQQQQQQQQQQRQRAMQQAAAVQFGGAGQHQPQYPGTSADMSQVQSQPQFIRGNAAPPPPYS